MGNEEIKPNKRELKESDYDPDDVVMDSGVHSPDAPDEIQLGNLQAEQDRANRTFEPLRAIMPAVIDQLRQSLGRQFLYITYKDVELTLKRALRAAGKDYSIVSNYAGIVSKISDDFKHETQLKIRIWPKGRDDISVYEEIISLE